MCVFREPSKTLSGMTVRAVPPHREPVSGLVRFVNDYRHEPVDERHLKHLLVQASAPFNAETRAEQLAQQPVTPVARFYVRNHGPVPLCPDVSQYRLVVDMRQWVRAQGADLGGDLFRQFRLDELRRRFHFVQLEATLQCAGNRRTELAERAQRAVRGVGWQQGAVGNAVWGGVPLVEVLLAALGECTGSAMDLPALAGADDAPEPEWFVEFEGADWVPEEARQPPTHPAISSPGYRASVPLRQVLDGTGQTLPVLLATEMNGQPLTRDHGYPLRCVVPGMYGARSVKWLWRIALRRGHSDGFFVQRDYKMLPSWMDGHQVDWNAAPPLMETNVQCAICVPAGREVRLSGHEAPELNGGEPRGAPNGLAAGRHVVSLPLRGYACSGGGRRIVRVEVSGDGGRTWQAARFLDAANKEVSHETRSGAFSWRLWVARVPVAAPCQVVCRAVDEAANTQPDDVVAAWNLRGVAHNTAYRLQVLPPLPTSAGTHPPLAKL